MLQQTQTNKKEAKNGRNHMWIGSLTMTHQASDQVSQGDLLATLETRRQEERKRTSSNAAAA